jgi:hypothetical protein
MYFPICIMLEASTLRTFIHTNFKEPSYGWNKFSDFYVTVIGGCVSYVFHKIVAKATWNFLYKYQKEKNNEAIRLAKTHKTCEAAYKGLYFLGATVWGYYLLIDEDFFPPSLLGHGSYEAINKNFPTHNF